MSDSGSSSGADSGSIITAIRNGVTAVTLIVGAIVSLNTFVVNRATQKINDHAEFHKAVKSEEDYWSGLYKDYEGAFAGELKADDERRKLRLFVISQLAAHNPPDFSEYNVPPALKAQAQAQFKTYQSGLQEALRAKSTPEIQTALQTQVNAEADATITRPANGGLSKDQPKETVQAAAPGPTPTLGNTVLSAGKAKGWDVDVFWCQGVGADNDNYLTASRVASALATHAKDATTVAGSTLGRIRLRPLPAAINARPGYSAKGLEVRHELGKDETDFANGLKTVANSLQQTGAPVFSLKAVSTRTPWYLSMFVCGAPVSPTASAPRSAAPTP